MVLGERKGNAYYHAQDLACQKRECELTDVTNKDLYIKDKLFARLMEEQKTLLKKREHWKPLRHARLQVLKS